MNQTWKSLLYEYVRKVNQIEVDGKYESILPLFADVSYTLKQQSRLERLLETKKLRQSQSIRSQMNLIIKNITARNSDVVAEIELHRQLLYQIKHFMHIEERIERQQITLSPQGGKWNIAKVVHVQTERRPMTNEADERNEITKSITCLKLGPTINEADEQSLQYVNERVRNIKYDRLKVQQYADTWWNGANPDYSTFEVDCSNFVSQCLFAGGAPMNYTGKRETGWWYQGHHHHQEWWSYSWAVAQSLQRYLSTAKLGLHAEIVDTADQLAIGDVIAYDWDGDGQFQHSVIVTALDANGFPLVNAHTTNSKHRFWDYHDSYAWSEQTKYRFFHIADQF